MTRKISLLLMLGAMMALGAAAAEKPWDHGRLKVSDNSRYLVHEDGTPFFWLGDTGWLLPERLDRDEADYYLQRSADQGYNVVLVQTLNSVPSINAYGALSHPDGWNLDAASRPGVYGYWEHLDHIIDAAAARGIYIGLVPIWGGVVKAGGMDEEQAREYGRFLGRRYGGRPNIVWVVGGDIQGNIKTAEWDALARAIRENDANHVMTFHPRGRTTSARWFNDREWLDFNMFQSGHRRYGQRMGNKDYPIPDGTEEDSWMYVDSATVHTPLKPVLDGEPSYEAIPQGLHSPDEPLWTDRDCRRYAYWSVFAGSCGHTYGHNNIMQFVRPGVRGAYFADGEAKPWWRALDDPGRSQMHHLKDLMLAFPYTARVADQSVIVGDPGERYERLLATRGNDYLMVYNHTGRPMQIDLSRISGSRKQLYFLNPATGELKYADTVSDTPLRVADAPFEPGADYVLIAFDASRSYLTPGMTTLPCLSSKEIKDLTE